MDHVGDVMLETKKLERQGGCPDIQAWAATKMAR
jgi:hypothetical protein